MVWSRRRVLVLLAAAVCLVAGLALWHTWVPTLVDGSSCAARAYSFGPGGGVSSGAGERAPAEVDAVNALCRDAARTTWWRGTTLLALGALLMVVGLGSARRASGRPAPQPDAVGSVATRRTAKRE